MALCEDFLAEEQGPGLFFLVEISWDTVRDFTVTNVSSSQQGGLRFRSTLLQRLLLTRLETRTKESIIYASLRVQKLIGLMKVSIRCQGVRIRPLPAASTDLDLL